MYEHLVDAAARYAGCWRILGVHELQIFCIAVSRLHAPSSDRSIVERGGEYASCGREEVRPGRTRSDGREDCSSRIPEVPLDLCPSTIDCAHIWPIQPVRHSPGYLSYAAARMYDSPPAYSGKEMAGGSHGRYICNLLLQPVDASPPRRYNPFLAVCRPEGGSDLLCCTYVVF